SDSRSWAWVTCPHVAKTPRTAAANHARAGFAVGGQVTRRARDGIERVPPTCATKDSTVAVSRVRLATMPTLTGSVPPAKMIGIVDVAALAASVPASSSVAAITAT